MSVRVGINGFGRMGRLAFRAGWDSLDLRFAHVNEIADQVLERTDVQPAG